jgi:hypothetical protein
MTPSDDSANIRLGALGWSHAQWVEAFYPPDMPEAWRLTFFNTQYHCAYLEQAVWRQAGREQWRQWRDDTHAEFRFLLEGEASQSCPEELADKAVMLRPDDPGILWFTRDTSLKEIAECLSGSRDVKPRYVISRDGDLSQMERVATLLEVMGLAG